MYLYRTPYLRCITLRTEVLRSQSLNQLNQKLGWTLTNVANSYPTPITLLLQLLPTSCLQPSLPIQSLYVFLLSCSPAFVVFWSSLLGSFILNLVTRSVFRALDRRQRRHRPEA